MNFLLPLLVLLLVIPVAVIVAVYTTVIATYWVEIRHSARRNPPDLPAVR
ncbi:hypothetical protein [Nocardia sp. NPDC005998]